MGDAVMYVGFALLGVALLAGLAMMVVLVFDSLFKYGERIMQITVVSLVAGLLLIGIGFACTPTAKTFELVVADWTCTASHAEVYTSYMMVGKVMMPSTHTREVCDNFRRR